MNTIYVVGSSNTDMVVKCGRIPAPGETVLGGEFLCAHGGKGANQAVAAARLGGRVVFLARVGDDDFGRASLEAYRKEGIDTRRLITDASGPSGVALIMVGGKGDNAIAVAPGVNSNLLPHDVEILSNLLRPGDVILLQLEIPMATVLRTAEIGFEKQACVLLDPAPAPPDGLPAAIYPLLHSLLPNEHEAAALLGAPGKHSAMAKALFQRGARHAIVKAGEAGVALACQLGIFSYPAYRVNAVDTTAAGDAFAGGYAVALAEGFKTTEAIQYGQKAAALSVTKMGAQPSLPTRAEVNKYPFEDVHLTE